MIASLLAVGWCSGPRSRYYSVGDKRQHQHAAGGAEKCRSQRDPLCSNAMSAGGGAQQLIAVHKSEYAPLLPFYVAQKQDLNVSPLDTYFLFFCERGSNIKGQAEYLHRRELLTWSLKALKWFFFWKVRMERLTCPLKSVISQTKKCL